MFFLLILCLIFIEKPFAGSFPHANRCTFGNTDHDNLKVGYPGQPINILSYSELGHKMNTQQRKIFGIIRKRAAMEFENRKELDTSIEPQCLKTC